MGPVKPQRQEERLTGFVGVVLCHQTDCRIRAFPVCVLLVETHACPERAPAGSGAAPAFSDFCLFKVAINIHVLVEDTYDIDAILYCQIHDQMVGVVVYTYWMIEFAALPTLEGLLRQKVKRVS